MSLKSLIAAAMLAVVATGGSAFADGTNGGEVHGHRTMLETVRPQPRPPRVSNGPKGCDVCGRRTGSVTPSVRPPAPAK